jgi:hypothetical protein
MSICKNKKIGMQETDTHTFSSDQAATSFFLAKQIFKSSNVKETQQTCMRKEKNLKKDNNNNKHSPIRSLFQMSNNGAAIQESAGYKLVDMAVRLQTQFELLHLVQDKIHMHLHAAHVLVVF